MTTDRDRLHILLILHGLVSWLGSLYQVAAFSFHDSSSISNTWIGSQSRCRVRVLRYAAAAAAAASADDESSWIEIPLLDVTDMPEYRDTMIQPLPSAHLPDELTTCHVYGMELSVPLFQTIVEHSLQQGTALFGHVALRRSQKAQKESSLLGAIGCTAQVLYSEPSRNDAAAATTKTTNPVVTDQPTTVLCRGSFRFIVREIIQTVPYTVARVQELHDQDTVGDFLYEDNHEKYDDNHRDTEGKYEEEEEEDVDDDEEDDEEDQAEEEEEYSPDEWIQRTLQAAHEYVDLQLEQATQPVQLSPLEASILQDDMLSQQQVTAAAARRAAQEAAAVLQVFESSFLNDPTFCASIHEQCFAVAFLAAELCNLENDARRHILGLTDRWQRLRYVCAKCRESVALERARRVAESITQQTDESSKDLKVGAPTLPPWARQIRKGTMIEYYWNEEWGWCRGEVVDDPILVVDELILTVHFLDDGSTRRLPFSGDEKARWRPASAAQ